VKNKERKIILNLAISLDGYIADPDGGFDWIKGDDDKSNNTEKQFSFSDFLKNIDTIVMGRKGYDDAPAGSLDGYGDMKIFVASSEPLEKSRDNIERINGDVVNRILEHRKRPGKDIWLYGGAGLTDQFIKAEVVDEYIIGIIPIILGKGRPLFLKDNPIIKLHLDECTLQEGIVILRYSRRK